MSQWNWDSRTKATCIAIFKKLTGVTPGAYRRATTYKTSLTPIS